MRAGGRSAIRGLLQTPVKSGGRIVTEAHKDQALNLLRVNIQMRVNPAACVLCLAQQCAYPAPERAVVNLDELLNP